MKGIFQKTQVEFSKCTMKYHDFAFILYKNKQYTSGSFVFIQVHSIVSLMSSV